MRSSFVCLCSLALFAPVYLAACGGDVATTASDGGGGSGGSGGDGSSATGGSGGPGGSGSTGGSAGTGNTGGFGGGESSGTGTETFPGTGGSSFGECAAFSALKLSKPEIKDVGGDGKWSPGESAVLVVTMTNTGDEDVQYPGVTWFPSEPLLSPPTASNTFFLIYAGQSMPIDVAFQADETIVPGTQIQLVVKLTDIQGTVCEELPSLTVDAVIE